MNLETMGFDDWCKAEYRNQTKTDFDIARVITVHKNSYIISNGDMETNAELSGKFLFNTFSAEDMPTTGDWVLVNYFDDGKLAVIHELLHRKSLLKRKNPGKNLGFQLIAANVDCALIIHSVDSNFSMNRIERYLVMVNEAKIQPVILISKSDLLKSEDIKTFDQHLQRLNDQYRIIYYSSLTGLGLDKIKQELHYAQTYCILGQSGVGKTTLINKLIGAEILKIAGVREKNKKGKHTTTRRQLIQLPNGSLLIDTPGLRELGNFDIDQGISNTFDEIEKLTGQCKFSDCTHTHEKECAVLDALEQNLISHDRYKNFLKIKREAEHYNSTYYEKRKKDKETGKLYKQIMKNKIKK